MEEKLNTCHNFFPCGRNACLPAQMASTTDVLASVRTGVLFWAPYIGRTKCRTAADLEYLRRCLGPTRINSVNAKKNIISNILTHIWSTKFFT